jgi:hypothetical protein
MLFLASLSLAVLIFSRMLLSYRAPGSRRIAFFTVMFCVFLIAFLVISVVLTMANLNDSSEISRAMALWHAATDSLVMLFTVIPAVRLLRSFSKKSCHIGLAKFGIGVFILLSVVRFVYNVLTYVGQNRVSDYIDREIEKAARIPSAGVRAINATFSMIFDFLTGLIVIFTLCVVKTYAKELDLHPLVTIERSDTGLMDPLPIPAD